jgi:N-acetyl-gamma-glutamyl-phosphate reductase
MKTRAAVVGASGYTARELFRLLARHPHAETTVAASREPEGATVASLHPSLRGVVDLPCAKYDPDALARAADCAFLALPHKTATAAAKDLLARGVRVVDLSADYRLRDPTIYSRYYGETHGDVENLRHAVYGLTELFASDIRRARLVANPGCYPTTVALGLAPLLTNRAIALEGIVVDSKSGVSGAGRTPKLATHFPECNESTSVYNLGVHRHQPEMEQVLADVAGGPVSVLFAPHLVPMDRGMLSTIYAKPRDADRPPEPAALLAAYREYYADKPFVRVVDELPGTKDVTHTNFCDVTVRVAQGVVVVVACIDNLVKGASGAAVQNFNLMFGWPETAGLL